jgi:hypothetical protein
MRYWLMKSEPDEASIDDLANAPQRTLPWTGVRNYQARNFMRDIMKTGDGVLFYHSSCPLRRRNGRSSRNSLRSALHEHVMNTQVRVIFEYSLGNQTTLSDA